MNIFVFLLLGIIQFTYCQNNFNEISNEEYKIYSTIIDSFYTHTSTEYIVINDSTIFDFVYGKKEKYKNGTDSLYLLVHLKGCNCSDSLELFYNYIQKNKLKYRLDYEKFYTRKKTFLLKQSTFNSYFKNGIKNGWKKFNEIYKNSTGYIKFTRVGFNNIGNKAFIYVEQYCGRICGEGVYYFLEKVLNKWKVIKKKILWIS